MRHADDALKELETALSITPSPDFAARVRQRIAEQHRATPRGRLLWWLGPAALAAGAVVIAVAVWPARPHVASTGAPPYVAPAELGPASPTASSAPIAPTPTGVRSALRTARPAPTTTRPAPRGIEGSARRTGGDARHVAEILVPDDERLALNRLLKAVREGRAVVPAPLPGPAVDADGNLLEPAPIEIPLIIIKPLPGTPVDGSGSKGQ